MNSNDLLAYYKEVLLKTQRGNNGGVFSNAKPFMLIAIIDAIDAGVLTENKIYLDNIELEKYYRKLFISCDKDYDGPISSNVKITPFVMPYFHLNKEPYYYIKWREGAKPPAQASSPSRKYLKENALYAYLEDGLWSILLIAQNRQYLRESLVNKFANNKD